MLTFEFVPVIDEFQDTVSAFSRGQMVVIGEYGKCASPDMMLMLSLCDFLSGLLAFLTGYEDKQYTFSSIYGNYGLKVVKKKRSPLLSLFCVNEDRLIAKITQEELTNAIWSATRSIHARYEADFPAVISTHDDMLPSEVDIKEEWQTLLNRWLMAFPNLSQQPQ